MNKMYFPFFSLHRKAIMENSFWLASSKRRRSANRMVYIPGLYELLIQYNSEETHIHTGGGFMAGSMDGRVFVKMK